MGAFTQEQAIALLSVLKAEGILSLVIGGGEPLAWRFDTLALAGIARALGFFVQLGSNGILLPEGFERNSSIDRYVLPLDGASAEVHNSIRLWRGDHFKIVKERLGKLRDARKSTTISTVVTRKNYQDLGAIFEALLSLNNPDPFLHAWHLYHFIPEGRGGHVHAKELLMDRKEYESVTAPFQKKQAPFEVFRRPDMLKSKVVEFFWVEGGQVHGQLGEKQRIVAT